MPFPRQVALALAHRAAFICSNPTCHALTIMPELGNHTGWTHKGGAAHIHGEKPKSARYDPNMTASERRSAENGLWLCTSCHDTVDKLKGNSFTAEQLRGWKREHAALIRQTALDAVPGLPIAQLSTKQAQIARRALSFLNDRGVFFNPFEWENPQHALWKI